MSAARQRREFEVSAQGFQVKSSKLIIRPRVTGRALGTPRLIGLMGLLEPHLNVIGCVPSFIQGGLDNECEQ